MKRRWFVYRSGINTAVLIDDTDMRSVTGDITSDNSDSLNLEQSDVKNKMENSGIYQKYADAYKNQFVYEPNK
ncbi:MAG: hypothetical protein WCD89_09155 [Anaerocolumna sp.]